MTESSTPYVLVVEDDHDVRETLADALREEGYRVGSAENGLAALEFLRTHTTQLVLLDLMMPVMDGWQFRTRQLADPALAHVPVVVISAHSGNNLGEWRPPPEQTHRSRGAADARRITLRRTAILKIARHSR